MSVKKMPGCPKDIKRELGLVQVYTGNGKGKTTTAMGLAFRAAGRGLNIIMLQFLKPPRATGNIWPRRGSKDSR